MLCYVRNYAPSKRLELELGAKRTNGHDLFPGTCRFLARKLPGSCFPCETLTCREFPSNIQQALPLCITFTLPLDVDNSIRRLSMMRQPIVDTRMSSRRRRNNLNLKDRYCVGIIANTKLYRNRYAVTVKCIRTVQI